MVFAVTLQLDFVVWPEKVLLLTGGSPWSRDYATHYCLPDRKLCVIMCDHVCVCERDTAQNPEQGLTEGQNVGR